MTGVELQAMPPCHVGGLEPLLARARALLHDGGRRILGIAGAPGAGKSALAAALVRALGPQAVLVPMDGFHLADAELIRLGRRDRKGAADTFDAAGYVSLLRRMRDPAEAVVYAPEFRREIEEPIAGAIAVPRSVGLIVTEGNYLLLDTDAWAPVRGMLDEVWFVDPGEDVRIDRLVARHIAYGKSEQAARAWSLGPDQQNAELIATTKARASLLVRLTERV